MELKSAMEMAYDEYTRRSGNIPELYPPLTFLEFRRKARIKGTYEHENVEVYQAMLDKVRSTK
jgi:hypothetical protein